MDLDQAAAHEGDRGRGIAGLENADPIDQDHLGRALDRLAEALHGDGQLRLVYQPRISLEDGRCTSVEALLRWVYAK